MDIRVPQELLQEVVDYLTKKPYAEVASKISRLMQCKKVEEKPEKKDLKKKDLKKKDLKKKDLKKKDSDN